MKKHFCLLLSLGIWCTLLLPIQQTNAQTRSLTVNSTGVVNEIITVGVPEIASASGLSISVPYATGTVSFDDPIYINLDTDFSNQQSHYVIGSTVSVTASISGGADDLEVYFSIQWHPTLNGLNSIPEDVATDLWLNTYTLADGESVNDIFQINYIIPTDYSGDDPETGDWVRFRWEVRWASLGFGSSVSENTVRVNLVDQIAPVPTATPSPTPTPQPTNEPTNTPTATHTPTFTPTPIPTSQQISGIYHNVGNIRAVPVNMQLSQYSGGSYEIESPTAVIAVHGHDGKLHIIGARQLDE